METRLTKIVRLLLGALLLFAGSSKLFGFGPEGGDQTGAAAAFHAALVGSGYLIPSIGLVEAAAGAAFLSGRFVALAAVVLAPITYNIVCFHLFLAPSDGAPGYFVGLANVYLLAVHWPKYQDMLMPR